MRLRLAKKIHFSGTAWRYSAVQRAQAYRRVLVHHLRHRLRSAPVSSHDDLRRMLSRPGGIARGKKHDGRRGRAHRWRIDHGLDVKW